MSEGETYKVCNTCGEKKGLSSFHKQKNGKYGVRRKCRKCVSKYRKDYYQNNKEELKEYSRKFYNDNKDYYNKNKKTYKRYNTNRFVSKLLNKSIERNFEEFRDKLNQSKFCSKCGEYKDFDEFYDNKRCKYNRYPHCKGCNNKKHLNYRRNDPSFKIRCNLSQGIWKVLKGIRKSKSTMKLLDCTTEELWQHLESQFEDGMTRENYGDGWHVDHEIPCSLFDLEDPKQQAVCFHWSNLQPLWAEDNLSKSNNIKGFEELTIDKEFLNTFLESYLENNQKHNK